MVVRATVERCTCSQTGVYVIGCAENQAKFPAGFRCRAEIQIQATQRSTRISGTPREFVAVGRDKRCVGPLRRSYLGGGSYSGMVIYLKMTRKSPGA